MPRWRRMRTSLRRKRRRRAPTIVWSNAICGDIFWVFKNRNTYQMPWDWNELRPFVVAFLSLNIFGWTESNPKKHLKVKRAENKKYISGVPCFLADPWYPDVDLNLIEIFITCLQCMVEAGSNTSAWENGHRRETRHYLPPIVCRIMLDIGNGLEETQFGLTLKSWWSWYWWDWLECSWFSRLVESHEARMTETPDLGDPNFHPLTCVIYDFQVLKGGGKCWYIDVIMPLVSTVANTHISEW